MKAASAVQQSWKAQHIIRIKDERMQTLHKYTEFLPDWQANY